MRILADLHHEDLFRSLNLLAGRIGAELFRPKGLEWYKEGRWCVFDHINTANQYLGDDCYKEYPGVGLNDAINTDWDLVLVTHCHHFVKWSEMFKGRSPVVLQVGNNWNYNHPMFSGAKNVLNSTSTQWPQADNHVRYHPELEPSGAVVTNPYSIYSFCHYPTDLAQKLFKELGKRLPDWDLRLYGAGTDRGGISGQDNVIRLAAECGFLFHHKAGGDGYGVNIHRAWSNGKPIIMDYNHYADKMAAMCMVDGLSSIDLSLGVETVASMLADYIGSYAEDSDHVKGIWRRNCDPDNEWETKLKPFFEKILK